ncbi:MAG TPA: hypothetical protein PLK28_15660 [Candidatus Rifleibacterium sp.]|nr:hypothetical protein [Candidatus Rifleibacterium sp.]
MKAVSLRTRVFVFLFFLINLMGGSWAVEIGYDEEFSLAEDRSVPLQQLIPGTEDYYYYHCLYHQSKGETAKVASLLKQWVGRYSHSSRYEEIRTRQLLLDFNRNPETILQFIIERLNLQFNHARKQPVTSRSFPSRMPSEWLDYQNLKNIALREYNDLSGFKYPGLEALVKEEFVGDRRRDLLNRLQYPDGEKIAQMVVDDLQHQYSGGFGSLPIHGKLLPEQLDFCSRAMPALLEQTPFVLARLKKMQPGADSIWETDPVEKLAVLKQMYAFVSPLQPAFNSLKAHLLYNILDLQRNAGSYDRNAFLEYLKLPRNVGYIDSRYLNSNDWKYNRADLNADFRLVSLCPAINNDEPLIRDYLARFMLEDKGSNAFSGIIESEYLKRLLAETMIVNAAGDLEQWFSLLGGQAVKELKERIELEFLPTCRPVYQTGETVKLAVRVKNVNRLMLKIYKLNLASYYRENGSEVSTAIDLDGLVANEELSFDYKHPSWQRHEETFVLDKLGDRGVYIVELIGNGISSRAMIRRGQLSYLQRASAAGHVFTIFDEQQQLVKDAVIMLAGTEYRPDQNGQIVVPYTTSPGNRQIIIRQGEFAALHTFSHLGEAYSLEASIHVDREALLAGRTAKVIVRPVLSINGCPADVGLLQEPALLITSVDRDGVSSTREITDFKLFNDKETVHEFKTPDKLRSVTFSLRGRIDNLSNGRKDDLSVARSFTINGIDNTERTHAFFVRRENGEYVAELLGKSGEPCPDRVINLEISHRLIRRNVTGSLQTDEKGRIYLGRLDDVEYAKLSAPDGVSFDLLPIGDQNTIADSIAAPLDYEIRVPRTDNQDKPIAEQICLYEMRGGELVRDWRSAVSLVPGFYSINGLPAGDYEMYIRQLQQKIAIRVAAGKILGGYVISKRRGLPLNNTSTFQITEAKVAEDAKLLIRLANSGKKSRVHVIAGNFMPEFRPFAEFANIGGPVFPTIALTPPVSRYVSGRNIGDEYRYILERRFAKIFPGNMLKRPGLLLNPWSLRKTDTGTQEASAGGAWAGAPEPEGQRSSSANLKRRMKEQAMADAGGYGSYDFLASASVLLANLKPDADGTISVPVNELQGLRNIQIIAVDGFDIACREVTVPGAEPEFLDLRLKNALVPEKHFSEQKNISVVATGETVSVADISTARVEVYDSLKSAYRLLSTINPDASLIKFGFITGWNSLDEKQKLDLYSKHACHELNFFISQRDRSFFEKVVKPYIANKRDLTFMDKWLLERDLREFTEPWTFSRLNIVEKILLGQRVPEMAETIERHVNEKFDLLPDDRERFNSLFKTALQGNALETGDKLGLESGKKMYSDKLEEARRNELGDMPVPEPEPMDLGKGIMPSARSARPMAAPAPPPPPAMMAREAKVAFQSKADFSESEEMAGAAPDFAEDDFDVESDSEMREPVRQLFRQVDKTEEWVENNYYQLPIEQQTADLIQVNAFWRDYAMHKPGRPFVSGNFIFATRNFAEMMLALAVLDLPFASEKHGSDFDGPRMTIKAGSNAVIFREEIGTASETAETASILTGQNFFAQNDRYRYERNERFDKFVTDEFLTRVVYGCQVVVTNPTSSRRKVDVLMQIPEGALPVLRSLYTRSVHMQLEAYSTQTFEYFFYFPKAGGWKHYPVHVSENEVMLATTKPFVFKVVEELTNFDKNSWPWLSQNGTDAQILDYLEKNNIERLDLVQIAFRLKDRDFFIKVTDLLKKRHVFNDVIWSYGLMHGHLPAMKDYLPYTALAGQVGSSFESELLRVNPVARHTYQHREYWPLVNARVYPLGKRREILNQQFAAQYHALLADLRYRSQLNDHDLMAVVYYLLLQDRIEEASKFFGRIKDATIVETIQYRYIKAYLAFSHQQVDEAVSIAEPFKNYPVQRWQVLFADVLAQAAEIKDGQVQISYEEDRDQKQRLLAATQPDIELSVENRVVTLRQRNLKAVRISYYLMDIELLFSRKPFVQEVSGQFSIISPNYSEELLLEGKPEKLKISLPEKFRDRNLMIEVTGAGLTRNIAYYPHSLAVSMLEAYGQVQVRHQQTGKPVVSAYVKVYSRDNSGQVSFYKDGYTDMRGRFDYASLSTSQLDNVEKFSILIMSDEAGSLIREASPPNR